ncbi:Hypothetical protein DHA2_16812, partial [Giardia duodenalis]
VGKRDFFQEVSKMTTLFQRRELQRSKQIKEARTYKQRADTYEELNAFEFTNGGVIYNQAELPEEDPSDELFTATYVKDEKKSEWAAKVLKEAKERAEFADVATPTYTDIPALPHKTELEQILDDVKYQSRMDGLLGDSNLRGFKKPSQKDVMGMNEQEEREFKARLVEAARKTITLPIETLPRLPQTKRTQPPRVDQRHRKPPPPSGFSTIDPFFIIPHELEEEHRTGCIQTKPFRLGTDFKPEPGVINHRIGVGSAVLQKFARHERDYNAKVQHDATEELNAMRQRTREAYERDRHQIMTQRMNAPKVSQITAGCIEPRDILRLDISVDKLNKQGSLIKGYDILFRKAGGA